MAYKFADCKSRGHGYTYDVYKDGQLRGFMQIDWDKKERYGDHPHTGLPPLPESEHKRVQRHFREFKKCESMGDSNPYLIEFTMREIPAVLVCFDGREAGRIVSGADGNHVWWSNDDVHLPYEDRQRLFRQFGEAVGIPPTKSKGKSS